MVRGREEDLGPLLYCDARFCRISAPGRCISEHRKPGQIPQVTQIDRLI
jgi:hypothetical protein